MHYAREALRLALCGAGFLFVPLLAVTALWFLYALILVCTAGFTDASATLWKEALGLKAIWILAAVHGRRVSRVGCQG